MWAKRLPGRLGDRQREWLWGFEEVANVCNTFAFACCEHLAKKQLVEQQGVMTATPNRMRATSDGALKLDVLCPVNANRHIDGSQIRGPSRLPDLTQKVTDASDGAQLCQTPARWYRGFAWIHEFRCLLN